MNHIYAKVWSHALGAWVVTSERAPRRGKGAGRGRQLLALTVLASAILPAMAQTVVSDTRQTSGDFERGIHVQVGPGGAPIHVTSGSVSTSGRYADGIFVDSGDAEGTVRSGDISVSGEGANGLVVFAYRGNIAIESDTVETLAQGEFPDDYATHGLLSAVNSAGIFGASTYGDVTVRSGSVSTHALSAYGVSGQTGWGVGDATGAVHLTSDQVKTRGDFAIGIFGQTSGTGTVSVQSGSVEAAGINAHGIYAVSVNGQAVVDSNSVVITGDGAAGILARGGQGATVRSQSVRAEGGTHLYEDGSTGYTYGISAQGGNGLARVESGSVTTLGEHALGIRVASGASAFVDSGEVSTGGDFADGIAITGIADDGAIEVISRSVTTLGHYADGIRITNGNADVSIDSDTVSISGEGANGILVLSGEGNIAIRSQTVTSAYAGAFPQDNAEHGDLNGVAGAGIWASSNLGSVSVTSDSIETWGEAAYGLGAETGWGAANAAGTTTVNSGSIRTHGDGAYGIYANTSGSGTVSVNSEQVQTSGDYAIGVFARSTGTAAVEVESGAVTTNGLNSHGIYAVSAQGNTSVVSSTSHTTGDNAHGILARGANGVTVRSQSVITEGGAHTYAAGNTGVSYGILAEAGSGAAQVESGSVRTLGEGAIGIRVNGAATVQLSSGEISTAGDAAHGIVVENIAAGGTINMAATRTTTTGAQANGIEVHALDADVNLRTGSVQANGEGSGGVVVTSQTGRIHIQADGRVASANGWAIDATANASDIVLDVAAGQVVHGGARLHSLDGSTVNIRGEIVGTLGDALSISGGAATINNYSNTIIGSIQLTDGDDVFNNIGTWVATGTSDFGGGNNRLVNTGLVDASSGSNAALNNLTTFVNDGTVDLVNGVTGDRLDMPGTTYIGAQGSQILVDVDFASGTSDALAVSQVQGASVIRISDASSGTGFNPQGISIIQSDKPLSGSEFTLAMDNAGQGLVAYGMEFDAATNQFVVKALPGAASFELIKAGAAAQDFWFKSTEAWMTRMVAARDAARTASGSATDGVWVVGHAGGLDFRNKGAFNLGGGNVEQDMSTESGWTGLQAGYDRVWSNGGRNSTLLGVTVGHVRYSLDFTRSAGKYELKGSNVGLYGALERGYFFAQALAKVDQFNGDLQSRDANLNGDVDGRTYGARLDVGLRFGQRFWIEPLLGASWVKASIDDFRSHQVNASFDDATSVQTRAGLRLGGSTVISGATLIPSIGVYAVDEHRGRNGTTLQLGNQHSAAVDRPHGSFTRAEASLTLIAGKTEVFLRAGSDFGSGTNGLNGRVGLRWGW